MKTWFITGMVVFWTVVVVISISGLVAHENEKLVKQLKASDSGNGSGTASILDEETLSKIASEGITTWSPELVALHNTKDDCWIIVEEVIYDITEYVPFHPGGEQTIIDNCGSESTEAFKTKGGTGDDHSESALTLLSNYSVASIGDQLPAGGEQKGDGNILNNVQKNIPVQTTSVTPVVETPIQTETTPSASDLTANTIASHNSTDDCWLIINNKVYNVTEYIPFHPGGTNTIRPYCGKESTTGFSTRGGEGSHSSNAWSLLDNYYIGDYVGSTGTAPTDGTTVPDIVAPPADSTEPYREAILADYLGANITKLSLEDDGRAEFKFIYNGEEYEGKMDASYNITKIED